MRRRWAAALAVAAFAAGLAAGLLAGRHIPGVEKDGRGGHRERFLDRHARLADELGLDADQRAAWDGIGREEADALAPIFDEARGRARDVREAHRPRLREILRPDQAARYDGILAEWERKRAERARGSGRP